MHKSEINPLVINSINIFPFRSSNDLIEYIKTKHGILVAVNAEKILHANTLTRNLINKNIGYADGIGAVMAIKKYYGLKISRIAGADLWLEIIRSFVETKTFYLIGGKNKVIKETVNKLEKEFPGIKIVNYRNGYINEEDKKLLIKDISQKKPEVVFVAMGSPKQELLMQELFKHHPAIYQGLGGSFDVYTGIVKRAPELWQKSNLEWLFRWLKQPLTRTKRNLQLVKYIYYLQTGKFK